MKLTYYLFIPLLLLMSKHGNSQVSIRDSSISMSVFGFNYSYAFPASDLAERFGSFSEAGISYTYKFKSNLLIGATSNYIFGTNVLETDIFKNISTKDGYLLNNQGLQVPVAFELRGFNIFSTVSYLIPALGPNPNSGFYVGLGAGFIQHKVFYNYSYGPVYQIEGDYLKGYDRLTNGMSIHQSVGYHFFSNKNLGNFHISLIFCEAFTQNRRDIDFDLMIKDSRKRLDVFYGFNLGLDIPVYRKSPEKFYIN